MPWFWRVVPWSQRNWKAPWILWKINDGCLQPSSPPPHLNNRKFRIPRQRRARKRRSKSDFGFFQSLLRLLQLIYFELNSKETYSTSERERLFSRRLVMSFIKREIRHFRVAVVQWRQRNVQRSVMHVQSCCFCLFNLLLFWRSRCRRRRHENKNFSGQG